MGIYLGCLFHSRSEHPKKRIWIQSIMKDSNNMARAYKMLSQCNQALVRAKSEQELLQEICDIIVQSGDYRMAWIGFACQDKKKTVKPVAYTGFEETYLGKLNIVWSNTKQGQGPTGTAIRTGKVSIAKNIHTNNKFDPWRKEAIKRGYVSSVALPLKFNRDMGALNIYSSEPGAFDEQEIGLLKELAEDLGYGIQSLRTREALKQSEHLLRLFVEYSPAALAMFDREMNYIVTSRNYLKDYHLGKQNLIGRSHYEVFPEMPDRWKEIHRRCLAGAVEKCDKDPFPRSDGTLDWVRWEIRPWFEISGEIGGIILLSDVITRQVQQEQALKESEEHLKLALKGADLGLWDWNVKSGQVFFNERWAEMLDYDLKDLEPHVNTWEKLVHPDDLPGVMETLNNHLEGKTNFYKSEHRLKTKSGEWKWILDCGKVLERDKQGRALRASGTHLDITDRKRSEEALRRSEQLLNEVQRLTKIGGWEYNVASKELNWTDEVYRIYGVKKEGYDPNSIQQNIDFYAPEDRKKIEQAFSDAVDKGKSYDLELEFESAAGKKLWVRTVGKPIVDKGKVIRVVGNIMDITERVNAENELRKYREHLEEMVKERTSELEEKTNALGIANLRLKETDRLKSIFLASMSHELRTPLNSIIGFTGILLMGMTGKLTQEQKRQVTIINESSHHLLDLINDILDISKIEAGKAELKPKWFMLDDVIKDVVESFIPDIKKKELKLQQKIPEDVKLYSDPRRVKQILRNLISNAVKFTDKGMIHIEAQLMKGGSLNVMVIDTGIGIKEEDLRKLFSPFQQIDASLTKSIEGTGLGLYLCKKMVKLLGGTISAESQYRQGSRFSFSLPLELKRKIDP